MSYATLKNIESAKPSGIKAKLHAWRSQVAKNQMTHSGFSPAEVWQLGLADRAGRRGQRYCDRIEHPERMEKIEKYFKKRYESGVIDWSTFANRIRKLKSPAECLECARGNCKAVYWLVKAAMKTWRRRQDH